VDHVIAPLDADHARVVTQLSVELATALALDPEVVAPRRPHITIASYSGLEPARATGALGPVAARARPFTVRAHGYGVFTGDADSDLSLYVVVVRTRAFDELHRHIHAALGTAGACLAGTTDPSVWSPHITLLHRGLTPRLLGDAIEVLAHRPHRTWSITVESLAVARRLGNVGTESMPTALGTAVPDVSTAATAESKDPVGGHGGERRSGHGGRHDPPVPTGGG
jgi:2'-5' RNA ligase